MFYIQLQHITLVLVYSHLTNLLFISFYLTKTNLLYYYRLLYLTKKAKKSNITSFSLLSYVYTLTTRLLPRLLTCNSRCAGHHHIAAESPSSPAVFISSSSDAKCLTRGKSSSCWSCFSGRRSPQLVAVLHRAKDWFLLVSHLTETEGSLSRLALCLKRRGRTEPLISLSWTCVCWGGVALAERPPCVGSYMGFVRETRLACGLSITH